MHTPLLFTERGGEQERNGRCIQHEQVYPPHGAGNGISTFDLLEVSWYIDERIPIELVEVVWLHSSSSRL